METRNFTYMVYGLTVAWLFIAIYVITLALRERRLHKELDRVKRMLEEEQEDIKTKSRQIQEIETK